MTIDTTELLSFTPSKWEHFPTFVGIAEFRLPGIGVVSASVYDSGPLYLALRKTSYTWKDIGVGDEMLSRLTAEASRALDERRAFDAAVAAAEAEAAAAAEAAALETAAAAEKADVLETDATLAA